MLTLYRCEKAIADSTIVAACVVHDEPAGGILCPLLGNGDLV